MHDQIVWSVVALYVFLSIYLAFFATVLRIVTFPIFLYCKKTLTKDQIKLKLSLQNCISLREVQFLFLIFEPSLALYD